MTRVAIVGCGYTGRVLARRLIDRKNPVRATTTTAANLSSLAALGAEPMLVRTSDEEGLAHVLGSADSVVWLAPPKDEDPELIARRVAEACPSKLHSFVYGSTTGAFGNHGDAWVDETTEPREPGASGAKRLAIERALAGAGLPLKVVRIAGIYGPGRTLRSGIEREALILFDGAPATSRIHVEDLARILDAMIEPGAPRLAIACDELPAPTLDVARYTAELIGKALPPPVPIADAHRVLSKEAAEMRLGGHRCRSLVRERLIGALTYPTFKQGVRASLEAEGALRAPSV